MFLEKSTKSYSSFTKSYLILDITCKSEYEKIISIWFLWKLNIQSKNKGNGLTGNHPVVQCPRDKAMWNTYKLLADFAIKILAQSTFLHCQ